MTEQRRERIGEIVTQRKYADAIGPAAAELSKLMGLAIGPGDAVTKEAVESAIEASIAQDKLHQVWHRVWGARLLAEVIETMGRLADPFQGERALVVWGQVPAVGFIAPVEAALRSLPSHVGPVAGEAPASEGQDLLIVADDEKSGLRLEYNHGSGADEYELRCWGRFARSVAEFV